MASRLKLHEELCNILGSTNVYFQPPETLKLKYPCIVYNLSDIITVKADDKVYRKYRQYTVTLIHNNPDNDIVDALDDLEYCAMDRTFVTSGLNHYVFTAYY